MNILIYLNVSNMSNLNADSGFVFQKLLITEILKRRPDWNVYLVCPENTPEINSKVRYIKLTTGLNKYEVRFNFDWKFFEKVFREIPDLDIVYVNQPEQTENFFALINSLNTNRVKLTTYYHYLAITPEGDHVEYDTSLDHGGLGEIILNRQINAIKVSDSSIICSQFGYNLLKKGVHEFQNRNLDPRLGGKIRIIPPAVSAAEAEQGYTPHQFDMPTLVYSHRLYRHYGTETIFEWLREYYDTYSKDFQVVVTDPTCGRSQKRMLLDPYVTRIKEWVKALPFVTINHCTTREDYYKIVHKSHIGMGLLKPSALWSMSVVDAMMCRKPVLCPNYAAFPEMIGNNKELLFNSKEDFFKKLGDLLTDEEKYRKNAQYCRERAGMFDIERTVSKFLEVFEDDG